jgi:hypothetical protein
MVIGMSVHDTSAPAKVVYSYAQPVLRFVLLSFFTLGIFNIYWYYRNWKHLKNFRNVNISPGWKTVGLFIPLVGFVLIYGAHRDYKYLIEEEAVNRKLYPGWIILILIVCAIMTRLPGAYWLLGYLSIIPLAIVQGVLNDLWAKVQPEFPMRTKWRAGEIVLLIFGILFWVLIVIGLIVS